MPSSDSYLHSIPVRFSVEWVSAEGNMDDAQIAFDSVVDWIERGGGMVQGGLVQRMSNEDVVLGSPLDFELRRRRSLNGERSA